jgi:hypothetical protein
MKSLLIVATTVLISVSAFSQAKQPDSVFVMPAITVLKFNQEQMGILNAILANQDFSRKQFADFLELVNKQINEQMVKVPVKKETPKKP